ncbi:MAG: hypothetical protein VR64_18140 [Desulfatitalea sp. BRH_c12]|nr:MAG: hypothetical protein VR64_18140 [Desulfatitalea sp. BRH_c12]
MIKLQRNLVHVDDMRKSPRIDFHLQVTIIGMNIQARILDFSLTGFYIQVDCTEHLWDGQLLKLALRFPTERNSIVVKARIVRTGKHGFGCEFLSLDPAMQELLERNFDIFKNTMPIQ